MHTEMTKKALFAIFIILSTCLTTYGEDGISDGWKKKIYESIITYSITIRPDQVPIKRKRIDKTLEFIRPSGLKRESVETVIIILGNMPLDESTPTVDTVYRVLKGVELFQSHPNSLIIFTGGKTAGRISEAEMMGIIAWSRGVPADRILLEEQAQTTKENADFSSQILINQKIDRAFLVTKKEHLPWALPYFKKYSIFHNIQSVDCGVSFEQIIGQMEAYLKANNNIRVEQRLKDLKNGIKGVD